MTKVMQKIMLEAKSRKSTIGIANTCNNFDPRCTF